MMLDAIKDYVQRGFSLVPFNAIRPAAGESKWKKKPIVKWEDRQKRAPRENEILSEFKKFPNALVGCVTGKISGICTLDIDDDEGRKLADELVPDSLIVPTFQTMSGGLQMIFKNPEPSIPGKVRFLPGLDYRGEGSLAILPPSNNGNGGQYRWLDGLSLKEVDPPSLPSALKSALINNSTLYREGVDKSVDSAVFFTSGSRNDDIFRLANALAKNNLTENFIKQTINIISKNCNPPFSLEEAATIISSAIERAKRRDGTLSTEVREWVLSTNGVFLSTDIYQCLQVSTREDKKNISIILKRLCDDGTIERFGNKNGQFRQLDNEVESLDWRNANIKPLNLIWPFDINRLVSMYAGNIGIIAGAPNAGKTAFLLNFIRLNQDKHQIHLFSSEGGKEELRQRISKFDYPLDSWKFEAWERNGDFADVVKPDDINIIDYLEIHDEFYKIGGLIKAISDRLKSGFALIALQKNNGRDEGLGGARGLEKPRLYLSMDSGRLKIVKAKSWVNSLTNPNGLAIDFKLVQGCKFIKESEWYKQ